jgi:hypothetical protein
MQSHESLRARNAPADEGKILTDCQSAIALWREAREPFFDPMLRPTVGRRYSNFILPSTKGALPSRTGPATGSQAIRTERTPTLFPKKINRTSLLTWFATNLLPDARKSRQQGSSRASAKTDYMFVVCDLEGARFLQTLHAHVESLRKSPDFHAAQTRKPRTHSTGYSWRDIPIAELDLPTAQTPWDSEQAFCPFKRDIFDCRDRTERLSHFLQLRQRAIKGHGKATVACRVDILGGPFPLSNSAPGSTATPGACLFCHEAPTDTLHHLLHRCPMNRRGWEPLLPDAGHGTPDLNRGWGRTPDSGKSGVGVGVDPRFPANRGSIPGMTPDGRRVPSRRT